MLLDGLDETPNAEQVRERLRQIIRRFTRDYPAVRILVTSRPYAYQAGSEWRLDDSGFAVEELAPFESEQIDQFVRYWYGCLAAEGDMDGRRATGKAGELVELIGQYEYGLKYRIYEIVNHVVGNDLLDADYVHRVEDVTILAPILYPSKPA